MFSLCMSGDTLLGDHPGGHREEHALGRSMFAKGEQGHGPAAVPGSCPQLSASVWLTQARGAAIQSSWIFLPSLSACPICLQQGIFL